MTTKIKVEITAEVPEGWTDSDIIGAIMEDLDSAHFEDTEVWVQAIELTEEGLTT